MKAILFYCCLIIGLGANAQQKQLRVYSLPDSLPISGASISVQGKAIGTSNEQGAFMVGLGNGNYPIQIKHLGYVTLATTITLPSPRELQFYLMPDVNLLNEVTINTGYQTLPKERATGSFVTINNKQLNEQMSTDIISRLEAVANGITVDKRSSSQGNLMVRGLSTIAGPKDPLIILDNFPYQGDLQNINPNDIENITILKDAAATSIWGSRAGNGVIVLTSKKAKAGQPLSIQFNSNVSILAKPDLSVMRQLSTSDYLDMEQFLYGKGFYNAKISSSSKPFLSPMVELLAGKNNGTISVDSYAKQLAFLQAGDVRSEYANLNYENGFKQQHSLSLRGNEKLIDWNVAVGYDRNISSLAAVNDRLNFISKNVLKLTKKLNLDFGLMYTKSNNGQGRANYSDLSTSGFLYPYLRLKDENGAELAIPRTYSLSYLNSLNKNAFADWNYYPLSDYLNNDISNNSEDYLVNLGLSYQVFKGFSAKLFYQNERQSTIANSLYGINSYTVRSTVNAYTQVATNGDVTKIIPMGEIYDTNESILKGYNVRGQLNYDHAWAKHQVNILGGYEVNEKSIEGQTARAYGYSNDRLSMANLNYATLYPNYITKATGYIPNNAGFTSKLNRFVSAYTSMGYTFLDKYTLSGSARKDASNLFGLSTNDKWKPLWSVGAAWNLNKESFAKLSWINELKLRGSYGFNGNVDLSKSALTTIIGGTTSVFTNGLITRFNQFNNPDLRWENVGTLNLGLDFEILNRRLSGSVEVYQKNAKDLYGNTPVDYTAVPTVTLIKNVASIRARGLDLTLHSQNIKGLFNWSTDLNFNLYKDEVLDYYQATDLGANFVGTGITAAPLKGYPVYSVFSYKWAGLDPLTGSPRGYVNGQISTDYATILGTATKVGDLVYSGPAFPTVFGNIGNTFSYKGISLSARITYKLGYKFGRTSINYNNLFNSGAGHPDYADRWQKPGDELFTNVPSMVYPAVSRRDNFYNNSEVLIEKGDHVRLAYIALSYDIKKELLTRLPFSAIQLQGNASNLGILWRANKLGIDPDYRENIIMPNQYYSFGIRCTLKN